MGRKDEQIKALWDRYKQAVELAVDRTAERDEARAEVERLNRYADAATARADMAEAEASHWVHLLEGANGAVERVRAERDEAWDQLARYSKLPPLADGEEYASVGWWRGLDDAERERWEWQYTWDSQRRNNGIEPSPADDDRDHILVVRAKPPRPTPEPPAVEVGQWFKGPVSGAPHIVRDVGPPVHFQNWAGVWGGEVWVPTTEFASWGRCEPPTVAIKARDMEAGMVEAETGGMVYETRLAYTDSVTGEIIAMQVWWEDERYDLRLRRPDALYSIKVESLPDGWQPSGEGDR